MLKRFIAYYKPHRLMLTLDMLASLIVALVGMVYPIITERMLADFLSGNQTVKKIVVASLIVLALYLVRLFLRYFVQYYGHLIGVGMQAQMRRDLFAHIQKLPFSFYDENETGKIMTRMTSDLFEVSELAHHGPENLLVSIATFICAFIYLWSLDWALTLIIFICVPILIIIAVYFRKKMREAFTERRTSNATINASLESSISGIRVTKAYTNSDKETEKFEIGNRAFVNACKKAYDAMGKFFAGTSFITDIFNVIILIAGGLFINAGRITIPEYSAFFVSINLFISPINTLIGFMEQYQNGVSGFERFVQIMDCEPERDAPDAIELTDVEGKIEFKDVQFSYEASAEVLHGISLTVEKGQKLALVGPSGGGKTTICHLLPRFYPITEGDILIDGKSINSLTMESLRRSIGIVQQDVFLFNGSIKENILYGKLDATDDEVIAAAKNANIHDWITSLEKGYDTEIGERGVKLSGGQKQRLSIARVFLKDPAILILDEATSALDNTTEILIQQALDELCRGRTTIVVAHRLSTVRGADKIAVISGGSIAEEGSHEELMAIEGGIYQSLYRLGVRNPDTDGTLSEIDVGELSKKAGF
ncbi:MAG: ABC transporter ATP-binding protein [Clostridia bacterium]|nr:ABC transporter ATP-binding protein [Clostridia bacterium]